MARTPLYSRSPRRTEPAPETAAAPVATPGTAAAAPGQALGPAPLRQRLAARLRQHERWAWALAAVMLAALAGWPAWRPGTKPAPTLRQIEQALRESIAKEPLPSAAAAAYRAVLPSVVRVVGTPESEKLDKDEDEPSEHPRSVGTGVVIVDRGIILTNLHVVAGTSKVKVTFWDGHESEAVVLSTMPENDLAVLQAKSLPDDLQAATMRSTADLEPGDEVIAVGYPFGIGPSVSQGVVSGLKREFRAPEGKRSLSNLIQFDAAANPGNSGGPLVTMDGHVVGIVTAIMNPNQQRTFIGIGFAVPIENAAAGAGLPPF